jgi:hypothetical protein
VVSDIEICFPPPGDKGRHCVAFANAAVSMAGGISVIALIKIIFRSSADRGLFLSTLHFRKKFGGIVSGDWSGQCSFGP